MVMPARFPPLSPARRLRLSSPTGVLKLSPGLKRAYAQAIEGYLDYCLRNGLEP